jgi:hypothetical protein
MSLRIVQSTITADTTGTLASARASTSGSNLSKKSNVHLISTCATPTAAWVPPSVCLPIDSSDEAGKERTIVNNGVSHAAVFPDTGGVITCAVGSLPPNAAFYLEPNTSASFLCTDGLNYTVTAEKTSCKCEAYLSNATARVLSLSESGKTFSVTKYAGANVVTLPALTRGLEFTFVNPTVVAQTTTITSTGDNIISLLLGIPNGAATGSAADTTTSVVFANTAGVASRITMCCDGTNWHALATGIVDGGITTA